MDLSNLSSVDNNLEILKTSDSFVALELATPETLSVSKLCFVKGHKYIQPIEKKIVAGEDFSAAGIVFDKKYWSRLSSEEQTKWFDHLGAVLISSDMALSMVRLSKIYYQQKFQDINDLVDGRQLGDTTIHPSAEISQGAFIGSKVVIEENVIIHSGVRVLSGSHIGAGTVLYPNVVIYHHVKIGKNCRIHAQSSIGADGFGYHFDGREHLKIWHMGGVIIEDDVEMGSCSAIDQGTFAPTRIGQGSRIDNHVQIGHNCRLGRGVVICGHVAIGGSSVLGNFVVFGGKSGMGDNMELGDGCQVAGGALVNTDLPAGTVLGGHPARPLKEWMKGLAYVRKLSLAKD